MNYDPNIPIINEMVLSSDGTTFVKAPVATVTETGLIAANTAGKTASGTKDTINMVRGANGVFVRETTGAAAGSVLKKVSPAGVVIETGLAATNALNAYSENQNHYKGKQGVAAMEGAAGLGSLGAFALGGPPGIAIGVALIAAQFTVGYANVSAHSNLDTLFNPSLDTKRHMIGVGSGKFRDELADKCTGHIDWTNMDTLNKYSILLVKRIHKLEDDIKANDSYIPDGFRAFTQSGMDAVCKQQDRISELKIAQSAHRELQEQMSQVAQFRKLEEEAAVAQSKLTGGEKRNLTVVDLDRDHDGVLSQQDKAKVRELMQNDKVADMLFAALAEKKVTFENQPYTVNHEEINAIKPVLPEMRPAPAQFTSYAPPAATGSQSTSILQSIGNFFAGIIDYIRSFFVSSQPQLAAAGGAGGMQANTPESSYSALSNLTPPPSPVVTANQQIGMK